MPRRARKYLPGYPYHIVQRGNNREACFIEPENYQFYLGLWKECGKRYGVAVHAYCLMTNHIHFLVTPENADSISRATREVGSRYGYYFNKSYKRTGTLWEGRHKSSLVQSDDYLPTCMRYIEMNPVTAGMVAKPEEYKWSSYLVNAWNRLSSVVPHEEYLKLGVCEEVRCHAYRELFKCQISDEDVHFIERASQYCQPVGDDRFREQIEQQYGIKIGQAARGRPRKKRLTGQ
jgi:putative transposase